jgi:phosphatidylinositol alpha-1,6-mannosyltransferase
MPNREQEGDIEGFGMVFLEASAAGKPVVGGRSGGVYDSIVEGVTGLLVNPEDVDELASKLRQLILDRGLRQRLGSAGLQRAKTEFSWETRARRLREIGKDIADRFRASRHSAVSPPKSSLRTAISEGVDSRHSH